MRHTENLRMHHSIIELNTDDLFEIELRKNTMSTPESKVCSVCGESIKPYSRSLFTCGHNEICLECLHQYSDHCLQQKNIPKCLVPKCSGIIKCQDPVVMSMLTTGLSQKIKQNFNEQKLKNNKKCTMPDCYGFINNGTCDLCLTNFCQNCWGKQHRGECENPQINMPDGIKRCPECKTGIERDGGCLHITCTECGHNFCFACLQNWSKRHHVTCGTGDSSIFDWIFGAFRRGT